MKAGLLVILRVCQIRNRKAHSHGLILLTWEYAPSNRSYDFPKYTAEEENDFGDRNFEDTAIGDMTWSSSYSAKSPNRPCGERVWFCLGRRGRPPYLNRVRCSCWNQNAFSDSAIKETHLKCRAIRHMSCTSLTQVEYDPKLVSIMLRAPNQVGSCIGWTYAVVAFWSKAYYLTPMNSCLAWIQKGRNHPTMYSWPFSTKLHSDSLMFLLSSNIPETNRLVRRLSSWFQKH